MRAVMVGECVWGNGVGEGWDSPNLLFISGLRGSAALLLFHSKLAD